MSPSKACSCHYTCLLAHKSCAGQHGLPGCRRGRFIDTIVRCVPMNARHMDLAARNVLVGESNIVKIADFGMSEEMDPGVETKTFKEPIRCAIKWTAMESMIENQFSAASDCWSLGIVLWEICTYGGTPYAHVSNMDMLYFLIGGDRLMQPLDCPQSLWEVRGVL